MFLKETTAFFLYLSLIYGGSQEGNLLRVKQRAKQSGTNHSQIRFIPWYTPVQKHSLPNKTDQAESRFETVLDN